MPGLGGWGGEGGAAGGDGGVGGNGDNGGIGGGKGGLGGSGGADGAGVTEVVIVGAVTPTVLLIPSAFAARTGLAVMGPSLTASFDAASSDNDEIVTVT